MASYPTFTQLAGSVATPRTGTTIDFASNGDVRGQILHDDERKTFALIHELSSTNKATLDTFYTTNATLAVTLTWQADSVGYNCIFMGAPRYTPIGSGYFKVTVDLVEKDT